MPWPLLFMARAQCSDAHTKMVVTAEDCLAPGDAVLRAMQCTVD